MVGDADRWLLHHAGCVRTTLNHATRGVTIRADKITPAEAKLD